jgi:hypothetical protein
MHFFLPLINVGCWIRGGPHVNQLTPDLSRRAHTVTAHCPQRHHGSYKDSPPPSLPNPIRTHSQASSRSEISQLPFIGVRPAYSSAQAPARRRPPQLPRLAAGAGQARWLLPLPRRRRHPRSGEVNISLVAAALPAPPEGELVKAPMLFQRIR